MVGWQVVYMSTEIFDSMLESLGPSTLLLFNQHLHMGFDTLQFYESAMTEYINRFQAIAMKTKMIPIFREAYAQHFDSSDGGYMTKTKDSSSTCPPFKGNQFRSSMYDPNVNIIRYIIQSQYTVSLMLTRGFLSNWTALHLSPDCTHFRCYSRTFWSLSWLSLHNTLLKRKHHEY